MLYARDLHCFTFSALSRALVYNTIFHHIGSLCVLTVVTSSCRIPAYTFQAFDNRPLMFSTGIAAAAAANKHVTPVERKREKHEDDARKKKKNLLFCWASVFLIYSLFASNSENKHRIYVVAHFCTINVIACKNKIWKRKKFQRNPFSSGSCLHGCSELFVCSHTRIFSRFI